MRVDVSHPDLSEIAAYCLLWQCPDMGSRKTSALLLQYSSARAALEQAPSHRRLLDEDPSRIKDFERKLRGIIGACTLLDWHSGDYPQVLKFLRHPPPFLFLEGDSSLLKAPNVAIVGTRHPTREGVLRARRLARALVKVGIGVTSGLAEGIDTAAHKAALEASGRTIAVIGTPLTESYPPENRSLQRRIARDGLVVSQFPFFSRGHRSNFVERNRTMASISDATVVIEAGETSGVRYQVKFCIEVGKPLFLARSLVDRGLCWTADALKQGARVLERAKQVIEVVAQRDPE